MKKFEYILKAEVEKLNWKSNGWSFLTSINYMLDSKLYLKTLKKDVLQLNNCSINKNAKILDFGTGSGIFALAVKQYFPNFNIYAIDTINNTSQKDPRFKNAVEQQEKLWKSIAKYFKVNFSHYNGKILPFKNNSFECVLAYAVLEHIEKEKLVFLLRELSRVIKKNGYLCVYRLPRSNSYLENACQFLKIDCHEILYSDEKIKLVFEKVGFSIEKQWRSEMLFEFPGTIVNKIQNIIDPLNNLLIKTPLKEYSRYNNFILKNDKKG